MNRYKPSIVALLSNQKPSMIAVALSASVLTHFIAALISVSIFSLVLSTLGFWYAVAFFTVLRIIFFVAGESSKYKMEQEIMNMKGGK